MCFGPEGELSGGRDPGEHDRSLVGDEEGLLAYWNFDELTVEGRVPDLSGHGHHGVLVGDASWRRLPRWWKG